MVMWPLDIEITLLASLFFKVLLEILTVPERKLIAPAEKVPELYKFSTVQFSTISLPLPFISNTLPALITLLVKSVPPFTVSVPLP